MADFKRSTFNASIGGLPDSSSATGSVTLDERGRRIRELILRANEERRVNAQSLRERIAAQKARAAAAGIGTSSASTSAVLRTISTEDQAAELAAQQALALQIAKLKTERTTTQQRSNLLEMNNKWLDIGARALSSLAGRRRSLLD